MMSSNLNYNQFRSHLKGKGYTLSQQTKLWRDYKNKSPRISAKKFPKSLRKSPIRSPRKSPIRSPRRHKNNKFVMFTEKERKNIKTNYNDIISSRLRCTSNTRSKIISAARGMYIYPDLSGRSKEEMCDQIKKSKKEKKEPIVNEDSITAWGNQAVEKYGLEVKDIISMKPGQKMKVILLDRNVGDYMHDNSGKSTGKLFDPKKNGFTYAIYTHRKGLSGIMDFYQIGVLEDDFTWEVNIKAIPDLIEAVSGKLPFWGPLPKNLSYKELPPKLKVGWRGPAIRFEDASKMPNKFRHYDTWWDDYLPSRIHNYGK